MKQGITAIGGLSLNNKLTRFWLLSILFVTIVTTIFIVAVSHLSITSLNVVTPREFIPSEGVSLAFAVELASVDPVERTFILDWFPVILPNGCTDAPSLVADIFINNGYLDSTSPTFKALPPYPPVYQFNSTTLCDSDMGPLYPTFRTVSKIVGVNPLVTPLSGKSRSSLQQYPFDVYYAPVYALAVNNDTGGYIATSIARSFGTAVNFDIDVIRSGPFQTTAGVFNVLFVFEIRRSIATKIFVMAIAVTDWLVATAFLIICASTTVFHQHHLYTELFVLPVGAVFALTSVRANFPGAPVGFGATMDLYSILPTLVIMACCSFYLLMFVLGQRLRDTRHNITNGNSSPSPSIQNDSGLRVNTPTQPHQGMAPKVSLSLPSITFHVNASSTQVSSMAGDKTVTGTDYASSCDGMKGSTVLVTGSTLQSTSKT
ncbi:hypothetical protein B0H11DRAFT_2202731 [Mycena galericulata]|nr:hypothetical protein B0H11DRAFT_2202731 [Mycena galericulata]